METNKPLEYLQSIDAHFPTNGHLCTIMENGDNQESMNTLLKSDNLVLSEQR